MTGSGRRGAAAVLIAAVLVGLVFLFAFWGRNAEGVGRRDMGMALALSFAVPITVYVSLALAVVAAVGAIMAWKRGGAAGLWLAALATSLVPIAVLAVIDLTSGARL